MLRYTIDNSVENRRILEQEIARLNGGSILEIRDCTPTIIMSDYEIGTVTRQGTQILITAMDLTGPGAMMLDLIRNIEERVVLGDDPLGDYHGRNS